MTLVSSTNISARQFKNLLCLLVSEYLPLETAKHRSLHIYVNYSVVNWLISLGVWCAMFPDSLRTLLMPDACPGVCKSSLYWFSEYLVRSQSHFMDLLRAVIESSCLHSVCCYHLPATHHESWAGNNFLIPLKSSEIKKKKNRKNGRVFLGCSPEGVKTPKIACL